MVAHWTMINVNPEDGTLEDFMPDFMDVALKAAHKGRDPDTPSWSTASSGQTQATAP